MAGSGERSPPPRGPESPARSRKLFAEIAEQALPYRSRALRVGDWDLCYLDEGPYMERGPHVDGGPHGRDATAETLLCVHGNPTWSFYWRRLVERFAAGRRVVAVDHLGCGRSDKPPRTAFPYTMEAHRDNLLRLIDEANLDRITLVAHDWGGAIGLSALSERRERFRRIVLLNTGAFPPPYVPWRIAACRMPGLGTLAVRGGNAFARGAIRMAMSRTVMPPDVARGMLAPYRNWAERVAIDGFVRDIPLSTRHPTYAALARLESELASLADFPSLLVWGMRDWCFRPECLRRFRDVWPDAQTVEIGDAGHYVMEDAPDEVLRAIAGFLDRTDGGARTAAARGEHSAGDATA